MRSSQRLESVLPEGTTPNTEQEDTSLVQASQQGDQDAFAILLQRHQRRVFNLVLHLLQDYDEANNVTQEAFLRAWQRLPSLRSEEHFSPWLYQIAYHWSLRQIERRQREQAYDQAIQAQQFMEDAHLEKLAQEMGERYEVQTLMREHFSQLPTRYRAVLILRHLQESMYEEMAQILTLPVGTIKTYLLRARNLLKQRLLAR